MKIDYNNTLVFNSKTTDWHKLDNIILENGTFKKVETSEFLFDSQKNIETDYKYIIPGLIDSHVHITEEPIFANLNSFSLEEPLSTATSRTIRNLSDALKVGITTIKDFGSYKYKSLDVRDSLLTSNDLNKLPRFLTSGCMLTKKNGHATDRGICISNISDLTATISYLINRGANAIKIINDPQVFSVDELKTAQNACENACIPLSVHVFNEPSLILCLDAGVKIIEHAGHFSDGTIDRLVKNNTCVTPTYIAAFDTVLNPDEALADSLFEDANLQIFIKWFKDLNIVIPKLWEKGVLLSCGTDSGFSGTKCDSLIREMFSWYLLGIPISFILQSATRGSAQACGMENLIGYIGKNYSADFVVYDSNPCLNPKVLLHPAEVWCRGIRLV